MDWSHPAAMKGRMKNPSTQPVRGDSTIIESGVYPTEETEREFQHWFDKVYRRNFLVHHQDPLAQGMQGAMDTSGYFNPAGMPTYSELEGWQKQNVRDGKPWNAKREMPKGKESRSARQSRAKAAIGSVLTTTGKAAGTLLGAGGGDGDPGADYRSSAKGR